MLCMFLIASAAYADPPPNGDEEPGDPTERDPVGEIDEATSPNGETLSGEEEAMCENQQTEDKTIIDELIEVLTK